MAEDKKPDLPFPGSPVIPQTFDDSKVIQFQCRKGISCWNACCSNIDISLTPYDILRLKRRFELSSGEFLKQYIIPYEMEQNSIAGGKLRPVANGTACQFMTPEGCSVYKDRPTACRYYPVALLSLRRQDDTPTARPTPWSKNRTAWATRNRARLAWPTTARSRDSTSTTNWRAAGAN